MDRTWSGEAKYRTLLAVAQAANSQCDLSSVLQAVLGALEGLVPVDGLGVFTYEGERYRVRAIYLRSAPRRSGESEQAYLRRLSEATSAPDGTYVARLRDAIERDRRTVVINDPNDVRARLEGTATERAGVKCAVAVPLTMGEAFVAGLTFGRMTPSPFTPDEVRVLEDVARPVTTAVANALQFEELQKLRSHLEGENVALREEIAATAAAAGGMVGASAALREVLGRVARVAATDSTVLITGETGTGKELVARAIHAGSPHARRALIKVNCAFLPEGLVASELFGHERGAFTGALERRRGRFELAAGGTIFLDEVSELPPPVQLALLRVLQEGEFERVGGSETLRSDARVVAATNRNLEDAVREGRFRTDLLFRLNVFPIHVPPLRERPDDIPILAEYFRSQSVRKIGKAVRGFAESAMAALTAYAWPGNIRELRNAVERAVILARDSILELPDFELPLTDVRTPPTARRVTGDERQRIEQALAASRGRVYGLGGAADALGVPPSTLESRIHRLGIDKLAFRRHPAAR